ncbi:hypothetical protein Bamb_0079 [Burkholderia ambifaria AMMD]|uniref:Uncharacterized protein n=1 Tax=Burkholderia ambifaria (strain ATCC BAA-244 / DSM 16087 / CCUG 44356 / LMG 19182 / AMMD) TaxID=339670 RepID=Q0BJN3_BURCM|nr:hypothetical protein Bamb_0079 [Burkholderia ambifaria AMMD]
MKRARARRAFRSGRSTVTMRGSNVVRMKQARKGGLAGKAIDAHATIVGRSTGQSGFGHARGRRKIGSAAVHVDANATTGERTVPANRAGARIPAAERLAKARAYPCATHPVRAAPAARRAPIHRPALLIQPYSLFCILLVGELPTDFPDRAVGES